MLPSYDMVPALKELLESGKACAHKKLTISLRVKCQYKITVSNTMRESSDERVTPGAGVSGQDRLHGEDGTGVQNT